MAAYDPTEACEPTLWGLVLAGGDGKRLQTYIRALRGNDLPKQYVNFIGKRSLLQRTLRRCERLIPADRILTIVSKQHLRHDEVQRQLENRPAGTVIVQPENRETGPGLLLPLMHLYKRCPDAIVAVFPSDHFIVEEERFTDHVKLAVQAVAHDPSRIVLLAMEADKPEVEYGYIVPSQNDGQFHPWGLRRAVKFVEKPYVRAAKRLVEQGALWNTMIMVFKARQLIDLMARLYPALSVQFECILQAIGTPAESQTIETIYRKLEPMNFSKGFLEKLSETNPDVLTVLPVFQVSWSDWGSPDRLVQSLQLYRSANQRASGYCPQPPRASIPLVREKRPSPRPRLIPRAVLAILITMSLAVGWSVPTAGWAQNVATREEVSRVLTVENLNIENGAVAGTVQNHSRQLVRDVQLLIRHTWLWDRETRPGSNDPGASDYYTMPDAIPPGGHASFNYRPAQPPVRTAGGQFETSVSIAGFTEVIPQIR